MYIYKNIYKHIKPSLQGTEGFIYIFIMYTSYSVSVGDPTMQ